MTTNIRECFVESVRAPNDVLVVPSAPSSLSALIWVSSSKGDLTSCKARLLSLTIDRVRQAYPSARFWLVMGNRRLQPDNRVTRHYGLWKALEKRGLHLPSGEYLSEHCIGSSDGVRFFGAVRLNQYQCTHLTSLLKAESGAILVQQESKGSSQVDSLLSNGWSCDDHSNPPTAFLEAAAADQVFVLGTYGEFDDPEVAAAIFGTHVMLSAITDLNNDVK
jgi:hypothetical protein